MASLYLASRRKKSAITVRDSTLVITPRLPASSSIASPVDLEPVIPAKPIISLNGHGSAPTTYS